MSRTSLSQVAFSLNCRASHLPRSRDCCTGWRPLFMSDGSSGGQIHSRQVRPKWSPNSGAARSSSISLARLSGEALSRKAVACSAVGTRPFRSRYRRLRNSASSAAAAGFSPWRLSWPLTWPSRASATAPGSCFSPAGNSGFSYFLSRWARVGSPAEIHSFNTALSFFESGGFPFGISSSATDCHSALSPGLPATTAGPPLPPLSMAGSVRRSSSRFRFSPPWQPMQFFWRIGSTSRSSNGASLVSSADTPGRTAMMASSPIPHLPHLVGLFRMCLIPCPGGFPHNTSIPYPPLN